MPDRQPPSRGCTCRKKATKHLSVAWRPASVISWAHVARATVTGKQRPVAPRAIQRRLGHVARLSSGGVRRHPHLFQLNESPAIAGHVEPVVAHFTADGLTREAYFCVVAAKPLLLRQKAETVINNIEGVMTHYAATLPMRRGNTSTRPLPSPSFPAPPTRSSPPSKPRGVWISPIPGFNLVHEATEGY